MAAEMDAKVMSPDEIYSQLRAEIRETDNISFRLLGLVPLLSGTALIGLMLKDEVLATPLMPLLALYAAAVTLGLLLWELCNIRTCVNRIDYADWLEESALEARQTTIFQARPSPQVGKPEAEKLIYGATIFAWLALPFFSGAGLPPEMRPVFFVVASVILGVYIGAVFVNVRSPRNTVQPS